MRTSLLFCLLCVQVVTGLAPAPAPSQSDVDEPRLFFVFGDSYADTGNTAFNTTAGWRFPYGETWPGIPSGRWSNGFVNTDVLASAVGLPTTTPYSQLSVNSTDFGSINFAVGGSGVTYAYGAPSLETQVGWFAGLVSAGIFSQEALNRAVVFVSVVGNDYAAYNGSALQGYLDLTHEVPQRIDLSLRTLYSLGARNFMVSSLAPLSCLPSKTEPSGYAECENNSTVEVVIESHNHFLENRLVNMTSHLDGSNVLYLQQTKAMMYVLEHLSEFGLTEGLAPCCVGRCSSVDESGNPLYTVCETPDEHFFWDSIHPTSAAWNAVVDLYTNHTRFTTFSPSLPAWFDAL